MDIPQEASQTSRQQLPAHCTNPNGLTPTSALPFIIMRNCGQEQFKGHFKHPTLCTQQSLHLQAGLHRGVLSDLASLVTESLVTPLALLQDACSSQPCSLHERSRQVCLLGCPGFGREGQIRDSSIYLDPLGKTNFFVLSENIWEPGILGRKIRGLKMYTVGEGIRQKAGIWVPLLKG